MEHILLKDWDNKTCQHMQNLREEVINLIHHNVCELQRDGRNIAVESADITYPADGIKRLGLEHDQGLYDRLIIEYNQKHPDKLLERWAKHKF